MLWIKSTAKDAIIISNPLITLSDMMKYLRNIKTPGAMCVAPILGIWREKLWTAVFAEECL